MQPGRPARWGSGPSRRPTLTEGRHCGTVLFAPMARRAESAGRLGAASMGHRSARQHPTPPCRRRRGPRLLVRVSHPGEGPPARPCDLARWGAETRPARRRPAPAPGPGGVPLRGAAGRAAGGASDDSGCLPDPRRPGGRARRLGTGGARRKTTRGTRTSGRPARAPRHPARPGAPRRGTITPSLEGCPVGCTAGRTPPSSGARGRRGADPGSRGALGAHERAGHRSARGAPPPGAPHAGPRLPRARGRRAPPPSAPTRRRSGPCTARRAGGPQDASRAVSAAPARCPATSRRPPRRSSNAGER